MRASASITINREVSQVYTAFTNLDNRSKFIPTITQLKILTDDVAGRGVKWSETRYENDVEKKGTIVVTQYKPPRIFVIEIATAGLKYKIRYNFQPEGKSATKIVATIGGHPGGLLGRFMKRFLSANSAFVHDQLQKELDIFASVADKL